MSGTFINQLKGSFLPLFNLLLRTALITLYEDIMVLNSFSTEGIGPRTSSRGTTSVDSPAASNAVGTGKTTLRLRSKGPPVVETQEVNTSLRILSVEV